MEKREQEDELTRRLQKTVDQFVKEFDVTVAEVMGVIVLWVLCMFMRAYNNHIKDNGEPPIG